MNCPRCWKIVPPESAFCLHCGHEMAATQVVPRVVTPIPPQQIPQQQISPQPQQHQPPGRAQSWTPMMVVLIVVALVAGVVGIVALVTGAFLQSSPSQATPAGPTPRTVVVYVTPTPTSTPKPTPEEPRPARTSRIKFGRGDTTASVLGNKADFEFNDYYLRALAGQTLKVELSAGKDMAFQVINTAGDQIFTEGLQQSWEGVLPYTGDYIIRILGPAGRYTLQVTAYP